MTTTSPAESERAAFEAWIANWGAMNEHHRYCAMEAWFARAALASPAVMPEGWVLVPKEPTIEMCKAAVVFANGNAVYKSVATEALAIEEGIYGEAYEAMLSASPQPPTAQAESVQGISGKWEGAEYWMPLAWALCVEENGEESCSALIWEGGPVPEPWGERWLKYEDEAKRLIDLVQKHTLPAPPEQQKEG